MSESSPPLWQVAVDAPLPEALTYSGAQFPELKPGQVVTVPLGRRSTTGIVLAPAGIPSGDIKIKNILEVNQDLPTFTPAYLKWLSWLAHYYLHPIGLVMKAALPPLTKKSGRKGRKSPVVPAPEPATPPKLTPEQDQVLKGILKDEGFGVHLLFGVTGSGKTEVYIRLLEKVLRENKQAIVLVPEIALTPQLIRRFSNRLGDTIAVIHSHLTDREKTDQWWQMIDKKKKILIGARSALFCPVEDLGLIIIDEEHEPSFKQDEMLKYNGRDAAIMLAKMNNCPIVLGSATPSLETWKNAQEGKYKLHVMKERVERRPMPTIEIVDLKQYPKQDVFWLSTPLEEKIRDRLQRREQVALFLNRRGMAQIVLCPSCGMTAQCPNCSVTLTLHAKNYLVCHYCDFQQNMTPICPECKIGEPRAIGVGTERIEEDLKRLFPDARIARADRDNINSREALDELITQIEKREVDILVGTQMIAKGLDFEGLTLVGMVLADIGFNLPDFRAAERSFQLLMQMGGRAGRHQDYPGEVIIQTYNPAHASVQYAQNHDYRGFAEQELILRRELFYPPYGKIVGIKLQGTDLQKVLQAGHQLQLRAEALQKAQPTFRTLDVLGPAEAPLAKLRGNFRFHFLIKGQHHAALAPFCTRLTEVDYPGVKVTIDIDPLNML